MTSKYTKYFIQGCQRKDSPYYTGCDAYFIWYDDGVDTLEEALEDLAYCRANNYGNTHTFRILKRDFIVEDIILEH